MKKIFTILSLFATCFAVNAQITLTEADLPAVGDTFIAYKVVFNCDETSNFELCITDLTGRKVKNMSGKSTGTIIFDRSGLIGSIVNDQP